MNEHLCWHACVGCGKRTENEIGHVHAENAAEVFQGRTGTKVDHVLTAGAEQVIGEQQAQIVRFSGRNEKQVLPRTGLGIHTQLVDRHVEALADQVGNEMFVRGMDASTQPQEPDMLHERKNNLGHGFFHAQFQNVNGEDFVEFALVECHHRGNQGLDLPVVLGVGFVDLHGAALHLVAGHFGNFADFYPVVVQDGDVQHVLQVVFLVVTDIGLGAFRR